MFKKSNKAFTLVELIVVITILAILGTIAFISLQGYSQSARDSKRVADIQNIKKSLELFSLNAGKYPLPDNQGQALYDGKLIWTQGTVGETVKTNLSRNLSEKPTDPLTGDEYTYSVTKTQKEYEVLGIYESDIISYNNILNQTQAETLYPKVEGTYNQVFVATPDYIVPTPSIINAEIDENTVTLNDSIMESQITTGGTNMLDYGTTSSSTGGLTGLTLEVYTGSISSLTLGTGEPDEGAMLDLADSLQSAYSGSLLAEGDLYEPIVLATTEEEQLALVSETVLHEESKVSSPIVLKDVTDCQNSGEIIYGTEDGEDTNLTCDNDIIVCSGAGVGYTITACNAGATIAGIDSNSFGNMYQFGKSDTSWINGDSLLGSDWESIGRIDGIDDGSANYWGVEESEKLTATYSNQNSLDQAKMQGPCATGYHIPTLAEWSSLRSSGGWGSNGANMQIALKLPFQGFLSWTDKTLDYEGTKGYYRTSSPGITLGYSLILIPDNVYGSIRSPRANGYSIRCLKN